MGYFIIELNIIVANFVFPVCEDVCNQMNLFDDGQTHMAGVQDPSQLKEMIKNPTTISTLEERVNEWIKKVMEVLDWLMFKLLFYNTNFINKVTIDTLAEHELVE